MAGAVLKCCHPTFSINAAFQESSDVQLQVQFGKSFYFILPSFLAINQILRADFNLNVVLILTKFTENMQKNP